MVYKVCKDDPKNGKRNGASYKQKYLDKIENFSKAIARKISIQLLDSYSYLGGKVLKKGAINLYLLHPLIELNKNLVLEDFYKSLYHGKYYYDFMSLLNFLL